MTSEPIGWFDRATAVVKYWVPLRFPKVDIQLSERKADSTLSERRLGGLHGLFGTKHQRGGGMQNHRAGARVSAGTRKSCPQLSLRSLWVLCWAGMYWWRKRWCINAELSSGFTLLWILWSLRNTFTATVLFTQRNQTPLVLKCLGCPVYLLHYECLFWMVFQALGCKITPQPPHSV